MINIDEHLADVLERRARSVVVRDDLDSILSDTVVIRFGDSASTSRRRRPQLLLIAAAGLVVVTAGLVWAQTVRNEPASTTEQPPPTDDSASLPEVSAAPWALPASANSDRIDAFPILDDLPASASASFVSRTETSWMGAIGTLQADSVPRPLVTVSTFPDSVEPFPTAVPGRLDGVSEIQFDDGAATLTWSVDDTSVTLTGADLDTMYSLVEHIVPIGAGSERGGYTIVGDLPVGLVELAAPYELTPMTFPNIDSESGEFNVAVEDGPFLGVLAANGAAEWEPITINSLNGFISQGDKALIVLALSGDETMFVSSRTMTTDQLIEFAGTIRIGGESEFRSMIGPAD